MGRRHYVPLRRRHNIPIRRREDVPLRRLGDVLLRRCWVFHLSGCWVFRVSRTCDVAGTYKETPLRRRQTSRCRVGSNTQKWNTINCH